jgi:hypothetical protein
VSNPRLTHRFLLAAALMVAATLAASAAPARAADFAMITIENPYNTTMYYQLKWGDGDWKDCTLDPYTYNNHALQLDEDGRAPIPYIRFDVGDGTLQKCRLRFYSSTRWGYSNGKQYTFHWYGSTVDLLAK